MIQDATTVPNLETSFDDSAHRNVFAITVRRWESSVLPAYYGSTRRVESRTQFACVASGSKRTAIDESCTNKVTRRSLVRDVVGPLLPLDVRLPGVPPCSCVTRRVAKGRKDGAARDGRPYKVLPVQPSRNGATGAFITSFQLQFTGQPEFTGRPEQLRLPPFSHLVPGHLDPV